MPPNVTVRTAHALAFRSVGYVYKSRLASSPWAWFPYLKEKMPRALDSVVRMGRDATSAGALIIRMLEQFLRTTDGAIGAIHAPYWCDDNVAATAAYAAEALAEEHLQAQQHRTGHPRLLFETLLFARQGARAARLDRYAR